MESFFKSNILVIYDQIIDIDQFRVIKVGPDIYPRKPKARRYRNK